MVANDENHSNTLTASSIGPPPAPAPAVKEHAAINSSSAIVANTSAAANLANNNSNSNNNGNNKTVLQDQDQQAGPSNHVSETPIINSNGGGGDIGMGSTNMASNNDIVSQITANGVCNSMINGSETAECNGPPADLTVPQKMNQDQSQVSTNTSSSTGTSLMNKIASEYAMFQKNSFNFTSLKRPHLITHDACFVSDNTKRAKEDSPTLLPLKTPKEIKNQFENSAQFVNSSGGNFEAFKASQLAYGDSEQRNSLIGNFEILFQDFPSLVEEKLTVGNNIVDLYKFHLLIEDQNVDLKDAGIDVWSRICLQLGFLPVLNNIRELKEIFKKVMVAYKKKFYNVTNYNDNLVDDQNQKKFPAETESIELNNERNETGLSKKENNSNMIFKNDEIFQFSWNKKYLPKTNLSRSIANYSEKNLMKSNVEEKEFNEFKKPLVNLMKDNHYLSKVMNSQSSCEIFPYIDYISKFSLDDSIFPSILGEKDCKEYLTTLTNLLALSLALFFFKLHGSYNLPLKCSKCKQMRSLPNLPAKLVKLNKFLKFYCHKCLSNKYQMDVFDHEGLKYLQIAFVITSLLRNISFDVKNMTAMATSAPLITFISSFIDLKIDYISESNTNRLNKDHLVNLFLSKIEDDVFVILNHISVDISLTVFESNIKYPLCRNLCKIFIKGLKNNMMVKAYLCTKILVLLTSNSKESASEFVFIVQDLLPDVIKNLHKLMMDQSLLPIEELIICLLYSLINAEPEQITWIIITQTKDNFIVDTLIDILFQMNKRWLSVNAEENQASNKVFSIPSCSIVDKCISIIDVFTSQCAILNRNGHELKFLKYSTGENLFLLPSVAGMFHRDSVLKLAKICLIFNQLLGENKNQ